MDDAGHGEPVFRLFVDDRVPAGDRRARLAHLVRAAAQDLRDHLGRQVFGEGGDVEREQHAAAHRVDIRHRVGRRDRAELVGVVDHRREEVERLHQRVLVVERVHGGVVGHVEPDEQLGKLLGRKLAAKFAQHVREALRAVLGASTAAARQVGQPQFALDHARPFP